MINADLRIKFNVSLAQSYPFLLYSWLTAYNGGRMGLEMLSHLSYYIPFSSKVFDGLWFGFGMILTFVSLPPSHSRQLDDGLWWGGMWPDVNIAGSPGERNNNRDHERDKCTMPSRQRKGTGKIIRGKKIDQLCRSARKRLSFTRSFPAAASVAVAIQTSLPRIPRFLFLFRTHLSQPIFLLKNYNYIQEIMC